MTKYNATQPTPYREGFDFSRPLWVRVIRYCGDFIFTRKSGVDIPAILAVQKVNSAMATVLDFIHD